jgi:hypothetical protein
VRRQLDFADADADAGAIAGGDLNVDEFFLSAMDDIERGYSEAKRRAPPCVCRRGECAVWQDEQSGRWMYVCSAQPVSLPTPSESSFFPLIFAPLGERWFLRLLWVGNFSPWGGYCLDGGNLDS